MSKFFVILVLSLFCYNLVLSQDVNPNGYNIFYYPNGIISSEGNMKDGKPDGYWRSYYEDGTLMSEGNRLYSQLDSVWNFYNKEGALINAITYRNDEKNGYTFSYDFYYKKDSSKVYYLKSKELYYLGLREGLSYFFDKNEKLKYTYNYKNDKRNGEGKEFDVDSLVITLFGYYNGYQIEARKINRKDKNRLKQGVWMEFYPSGSKKVESNYLDDQLHGTYKEYDLAGKIILEKRYVRGKEYIKTAEDEIVLKAEVKKNYYPDGVLQYEGAFVDNIPVGIHKEYDNKGKLIINKEYSSEGEFFGEGLFDESGKRIGKWKLYDSHYNYYYGEGNYVKGLKDGKWKYFYPDGKIEQEGFYTDGKPDREWIWYHKNGNIKVEEAYLIGKLEGLYTEFDSTESVVLKGEYYDDARIGEWYYNVGYITEKGSYEYSEKKGEWRQFYNINNKKYFVGSFINGDADGIHIWYYSNGEVKLVGEYRAGKKHKDWKKYKEDGSLEMTYTYRNGVLIKIDGKRTIYNKKGKANKK